MYYYSQKFAKQTKLAAPTVVTKTAPGLMKSLSPLKNRLFSILGFNQKKLNPADIKKGLNNLNTNPFDKELSPKEWAKWTANDKFLKQKGTSFLKRQGTKVKQYALTNPKTFALTGLFTGLPAVSELLSGDLPKAGISALQTGAILGTDIRGTAKNWGMFKRMALPGLIFGLGDSLKNSLDSKRYEKFKDKEKKKFLDNYYNNLSRSQWGDVAASKVMKWDPDTNQWYIPQDANYQYYNRIGI